MLAFMFLALVAQANGGGSSPGAGVSIPWDHIITAGVTPVIIIILLLAGKLYVGPTIDKERENERSLWQKALDASVERATTAEKRADASEERERRLRDAAEEKFLPLLHDTEQTMQRTLDFIIRGHE